jgi:hypothetical protein
MNTKRRYSVDSENQLVITPSRAKGKIRLRGRFEVNKNNQLIYWLNEPVAWRRQNNLPSKINFKGNWQIDTNYDLELVFNETKDQQKGDSLVLKGEIISVDKDVLIFEVKRLDRKGLTHIQLIKLAGSWQADDCNRLTFTAQKTPAPDTLTFEGGWQINKNQQITYTYKKIQLKKKSKKSCTLVFEGFWQINQADRLTYILSNSTQSRFDFRAQIESPNLYPKEGEIKYRLGAGLRQERKTEDKIITLYGSWKLGKKCGISFVMDYEEGVRRSIEFETDFHLNKQDEVMFSLLSQNRKPLGLNITFTHKFLSKLDAEVFLRIRELIKKESAIEAGIRIPF